MTVDTRIPCPSCGERAEHTLDAEVHLPPTGGDYDWCETQVWETCATCRARLCFKIRVWLDGSPDELIGVTAHPPTPPPWLRIHSLAFTPGAPHLAVGAAEEAGLYVLSADTAWCDPHRLRAAHRNRKSVDGHPAIIGVRGGVLDLVTATLYNVAGEAVQTWPLWESFIVFKVRAAHLRGEALFFSWIHLGEDMAWHTGVDALTPDGARRRTALSCHSGVSMSGRCRIRDDVVFRCHPRSHGLRTCQLELHRVNDTGELLTPIASREEPHCDVQAAAFDDAGHVWIAYTHHHDGGGLPDRKPFGLLQLDGASLEPRWRCHNLPAEVAPIEGYVNMRDIIPLPNGRVLLQTDGVHLLEPTPDGCRHLARFATDGARCMAAESGRVAVATGQRLLLFDLDAPERSRGVELTWPEP